MRHIQTSGEIGEWAALTDGFEVAQQEAVGEENGVRGKNRRVAGWNKEAVLSKGDN